MEVKMKKQLFVLFLVSLTTALFAQTPPDTLWTRTYGGNDDEIARCIQVTNDEGYIVTGNIGEYNNSDILLIRTDQDGNIIWEHTFDNQFQDRANSVIQTLDEGFIIAGSTFLDSPNFYDAWIIKTDENGDVVWDSTYGGEDSDHAMSVIQLDDGKFVIVGSSSSYGSGYFDAWLFKIDQEGNLEWENTFSGESNDNGMSLQQTLDGGFVITGYREFYDEWDVLLLKTDQNGIMVWDNTFDINDTDAASSILLTNDGDYMLAGFSQIDSTYITDALLIKVDEDGDLEWFNTYGGSEDEMALSVLQTDDSGYIVTGFTESFGAGNRDVWLLKTDEDGNIIWDITFGGSEEDLAYSIQQTNDDGFILAGYTRSYGAGNKDAYLIRLGSEVDVNDHLLPNVANQHYLYQNYPNPFNPETTISFSFQNNSNVELSVFNIKGQLVETLVNEFKLAGEHSIIWNAENQASGIYFYKLKAGEFEEIKKMILIK